MAKILLRISQPVEGTNLFQNISSNALQNCAILDVSVFRKIGDCAQNDDNAGRGHFVPSKERNSKRPSLATATSLGCSRQRKCTPITRESESDTRKFTKDDAAAAARAVKSRTFVRWSCGTCTAERGSVDDQRRGALHQLGHGTVRSPTSHVTEDLGLRGNGASTSKESLDTCNNASFRK